MPFYDLDDYLFITHRLSYSSKRDIFGIPFIEIQSFDFYKINSEFALAKYNNLSPRNNSSRFKIGHGFMHDSELWTYVKKPINFFKRMGSSIAWATPDFSIDMNATPAQALGIIEFNRWIGRCGQELGHTVFATVAWSREELDHICFAGLRDGAIFFISTLGVNNTECKSNFLRGYKKMRTLFPHSKIVCVGSQIEGMDDDIIYVEYEESFGHKNYMQTKLFTCISPKEDISNV